MCFLVRLDKPGRVDAAAHVEGDINLDLREGVRQFYNGYLCMVGTSIYFIQIIQYSNTNFI